jgi:hypothetical protein
LRYVITRVNATYKSPRGKRPRRGHCPLFTSEKNAANTIFSDDSGRRARRKCDGTDAGCRLCVAFGTQGHSAAIDAAITGPADKDRACMKALFIPEARMTFVSLGPDGAPTYTLQTLDEWIARVKARGHITLEEKQLKFHIERYSNIAHLWSSYALYSDGKQVARGINSIQAVKEAGGWRVTGIMVQAESATAPLPKEYLR